MNRARHRHKTLSTWQLIFSQSKVNGAPYDEEQMPVRKWHWPTGTYLQRRRSTRPPVIAVSVRRSRSPIR